MHPDLLLYLACPTCGANLSISGGRMENGHVEEGELTCLGCAARYAVRNGIPRMTVPLNTPFRNVVSDRVDLTVSQYSAYQGEVYAPLAESLQNESILKARTGLEPSDYEDKICLDAGCGIGRFSRVMARAGARRVIALDVGDSIDAAKAKTDPNLPVSFVQGHILKLPLKTRSIDRVISIGVLHHTANPEQGFRSLAKSVALEGSLSVYLYTIKFLAWDRLARVPFWHLRFSLWVEPLRKSIVRLPNGPRLAFCKALYAFRIGILEPLKRTGAAGRMVVRALQLVVPPDVFKVLENAESNIARNFDGYSTPYNYCHQFEELLEWFTTELGFNRLLATPYRLSMTGWNDGCADSAVPVQLTLHRAQSIAALEADGVQHQPSNS